MMNRSPLPLAAFLAATCALSAGCMGKRDPVVEAEIQKRYEAQDAALSTRNPKTVTAFCATTYHETNSDFVSAKVAPPSTLKVSTRGRVRVEKPSQEIPSLAQYELFLTAYFAELQSLSVVSKTISARVNSAKTRATVEVTRDISATFAAPEGQPAMAVLIQETLMDTWTKEPGKEWLKSDSDVRLSTVKRDRVSESDQ